MENEFDVEGYTRCVCGCGRLVLEYVGYQTGGLAFDCLLNGRMRKIKEIELMHRATRVKLPLPQPKKSKPKNKGVTATRKTADKARLKAMRRLRMIFPEIYELLYAEERHKLGLPPAMSTEKDRLVRATETKEIDMVYAALTDPGVPNAPD